MLHGYRLKKLNETLFWALCRKAFGFSALTYGNAASVCVSKLFLFCGGYSCATIRCDPRRGDRPHAHLHKHDLAAQRLHTHDAQRLLLSGGVAAQPLHLHASCRTRLATMPPPSAVFSQPFFIEASGCLEPHESRSAAIVSAVSLSTLCRPAPSRSTCKSSPRKPQRPPAWLPSGR